jgi:hypothetical protein
MSSRPFNTGDRRSFYKSFRFGALTPFLGEAKRLAHRVSGRFSFEDQMAIACMCEPPVFFLKGTSINSPEFLSSLNRPKPL